MNSSVSRIALESLVILVLLQMAIVYASTIPLDAGFKLDQKNSASSESDEMTSSSRKEQFRRDMTRQLLVLQQAEAELMNRIHELEAERIALSQRKRSQYTNMCLFNVVTCYRKRRSTTTTD